MLFGYSATGARVLKTLIAQGEDVVAVCTHPDDPHESIWFDSVASVARRHGIAAIEVSPANPRGPVPYRDAIAAAQADIILSASFRALIPMDVLRLARVAALNLHPSLLPRYRGRCPVNWVLVNGENETGMSLHHMVAEPDQGDVVGQIRLSIGPDETAAELQARMEAAAEDLVRELIPRVAAGTAPRIPQDPSRSSYFGRRRPEDGCFEWSWPARRIHNLVRAVTRPYPGAFVLEPQGRLFVWKTRLVDRWAGPLPPPGSPVKRPHTAGPSESLSEMPLAKTPAGRLVATGDGVIEVLESSRDSAGS